MAMSPQNSIALAKSLASGGCAHRQPLLTVPASEEIRGTVICVASKRNVAVLVILSYTYCQRIKGPQKQEKLVLAGQTLAATGKTKQLLKAKIARAPFPFPQFPVFSSDSRPLPLTRAPSPAP